MQSRFPWLQHALILFVILLVAISPYLVSSAAWWIGQGAGCDLQSMTIEPCPVEGTDWGGFLRNTYGLGWLMLATLPLGGGAFLSWAVITLIHRFAWSRFEKAEQ